MKKILLFVAMCACQHAFSQSDFRQAYIITTDGDTLNGLVDYREGGKNYGICDFKRSGHDNIISYNPYQIRAYGFQNDKYFVSKNIVRGEDQTERIFLEVLVQGTVTLYRSTGEFYVGKYDTVFHKLYTEEIEEYIDGKRVVRENARYIGILMYLMHDCPKIKRRLLDQDVYLTEKNLTKLVESYNNYISDAATITYKERKPWLNVQPGLASGINSSLIKFSTELGGLEHLTSDFDRDWSLMAGINFEFSSPRLNERMALYGGIFYMSSKYRSFSVVERGTYFHKNHVKIDLKQLKLPLGLRYTFPKRNITPYFNIGVSGTFHLETSSLWIMELKTLSSFQRYEEEALEIHGNQFGYWGGFGVKKFMDNGLILFAELRYEKTNGINGYEKAGGITLFTSSISSTINNVQFLIGVMF